MGRKSAYVTSFLVLYNEMVLFIEYSYLITTQFIFKDIYKCTCKKKT